MHGTIRNSCRILVGIHARKILYGKPGSKVHDNIKMPHKTYMCMCNVDEYGSECGPLAGCCERFVKDREIIHFPRHY